MKRPNSLSRTTTPRAKQLLVPLPPGLTRSPPPPLHKDPQHSRHSQEEEAGSCIFSACLEKAKYGAALLVYIKSVKRQRDNDGSITSIWEQLSVSEGAAVQTKVQHALSQIPRARSCLICHRAPVLLTSLTPPQKATHIPRRVHATSISHPGRVMGTGTCAHWEIHLPRMSAILEEGKCSVGA